MRKLEFVCRLTLIATGLSFFGLTPLHAQDDGGATITDGGGTGVLESIYVPNFPNAPFSLTLHTEWVQSLRNGGTFTLVNDRPIVRDSAGRIYMERWLLSPKGSGIPNKMSAIQIDDPVAHVFYQCYVRPKICEILASVSDQRHYQPERHPSGPLKSGRGTFLHEDLGEGSLAGVTVHAYRDTTTINAGALGNDLAMSTVREFRYSPALGFNLSSILDAAQVGRQIFAVRDLNTNEPDPKFFRPPTDYKLVDRRKPTDDTP